MTTNEEHAEVRPNGDLHVTDHIGRQATLHWSRFHGLIVSSSDTAVYLGQPEVYAWLSENLPAAPDHQAEAERVIQDAYNAWHMESRARAIEILHAHLTRNSPDHQAEAGVKGDAKLPENYGSLHPSSSGDEPVETRSVHWYTCDCEWLSKYCDEHHRASARIPLSVLERWRTTGARS